MKIVYLIACAKSKQKYHCVAEEMYQKSTLFRLSFEYALSRVDDKYSQIYILSAKHHLLPLSKKIDPYNETLLNMNLTEKTKWGQVVYNQMQQTFDMKNTHFIFLTGKEYMKPIIPYLEADKYSNPIPLQYGIGSRMKWLKENKLRNGKIIAAAKLRNSEYLYEIPNDMPGWYKWWAPKKALELLLNSSYISKKYFLDLVPYLTTKTIKGENYYYIYVGVAIKESIRNRLNWHVNQHHTKTSVESGFLSTLRQTISSLASGNQYDEAATNKLIDMLIVEYYPQKMLIKSKEAKEKIEIIERKEMVNNALPLNLRDNKNNLVKGYLKELSKARKNSK